MGLIVILWFSYFHVVFETVQQSCTKLESVNILR